MLNWNYGIMPSVSQKEKSSEYLVRFSEDLMDVIRAFKEEMEIISDRELVEEIARSEERSKEKITRVLTAKELKSELGL